MRPPQVKRCTCSKKLVSILWLLKSPGFFIWIFLMMKEATGIINEGVYAIFFGLGILVALTVASFFFMGYSDSRAKPLYLEEL